VKRFAQMVRKSLEYFALPGNRQKGQTMIEYALVAVLIAIVLVFVFTSIGVNKGISGAASKINSALVTS
jgi:Flp pilus assembly pilin Flp